MNAQWSGWEIARVVVTSNYFISFVISVTVALLANWLTTRKPKVVHYFNQPQWVPLPPTQATKAQIVAISVLTIQNLGRAPAIDVSVGHNVPQLPAHNVFPDIQREIETTPGGTTVIRFPKLPPGVSVSIAYIIFDGLSPDHLIQYVGSELGASKLIPVVLQRYFSKKVQFLIGALMLLGLVTTVNLLLRFSQFLWKLTHLI